jgi:hypothetical protein
MNASITTMYQALIPQFNENYVNAKRLQETWKQNLMRDRSRGDMSRTISRPSKTLYSDDEEDNHHEIDLRLSLHGLSRLWRWLNGQENGKTELKNSKSSCALKTFESQNFEMELIRVDLLASLVAFDVGIDYYLGLSPSILRDEDNDSANFGVSSCTGYRWPRSAGYYWGEVRNVDPSDAVRTKWHRIVQK